MKICQKCNSQNDDAMNFCLQCGAALPSQIRVNLNDQGSQSLSGGTPTNFGQSKETQNFINNQNLGSNFQQAQPPGKKSNAKIFLAIGGIGLLLLLFTGAGAVVIGYNLLSKPTPTPYPTTIPTRSTSPLPILSPTVVPTVMPSVVPSVAPTTNSGVKPTAKFTKMTVDFNVYENNQYGMRIHTNFSTYNLKGIDSFVLVTFLKKDGTKLLTNNPNFKGQNGEVVTAKRLKPNFDETEFKDLQIFMPYKELSLTPGKYDLQMDLDVIYPNYDLIQHLNLYDFKYKESSK